jgi:uncharacterized protein (DUF1800 family)
MAADRERRRVAHLLRRAGFGAPPDEVERCVAQGVEATVDELVNYERIPDTLDETLTQLDDGLLDLNTLEDIQTWWLYRMLRTKRPLQEKMTLFWHGHFATANSKVNNPRLMHDQNALFRAHALGSFPALALAVSKDPAMLIWLDGNTNRKAAPNENYGRELLELFTLGIGNYGERDVEAVARAFTGWNLTPRAAGPQVFQFNPRQHDDGPKAILGQTGRWNGDDALRIILDQPAHADFMATKLFRFFAYAEPEPAVVAPLAKLYRDSNYEIRPVVRALLLSEEFYSERAASRYVTSPVEYLIGAIRTLGMSARARSLLPMLAAMGHQLYNPPHVGGWPDGLGWVSPSALVERFNAAGRLTAATGQPPNGGGLFDPAALVQRLKLNGWEAAIVALLTALSDREIAPAARAALSTYVASATFTDPRILDIKMRGLVHLILTMPEALTS